MVIKNLSKTLCAASLSSLVTIANLKTFLCFKYSRWIQTTCLILCMRDISPSCRHEPMFLPISRSPLLSLTHSIFYAFHYVPRISRLQQITGQFSFCFKCQHFAAQTFISTTFIAIPASCLSHIPYSLLTARTKAFRYCCFSDILQTAPSLLRLCFTSTYNIFFPTWILVYDSLLPSCSCFIS